MSVSQSPTDFLRTTEFLHLFGRFLGVSAFSCIYGPSGRLFVAPSDLLPPFIRLSALLFAIFCYIISAEDLDDGFSSDDIQVFLFSQALKKFDVASLLGAINLTFSTFTGRHHYWKIIQEVHAIDSQVRSSCATCID